jgi:hypothetical protein
VLDLHQSKFRGKKVIGLQKERKRLKRPLKKEEIGHYIENAEV